MLTHINERVAYGRQIRHRAEVLLDAHGAVAEKVALAASEDEALSESDRAFWRSVAGRIARYSARPKSLVEALQ